MSNKASILVVMLAMVGCAGGAQQDEGDTQTRGTPPIPVNANDAATSSATAADGVALALPVEVRGTPGATMTACQEFQMPLSAERAGQAPSIDVMHKNANACARGDDGVIRLSVAARTQVLLALDGPGFLPFHVQVTTGEGALEMKPERLLSDDAIQAVYDHAEMPVASPPRHWVVVETPADDASVKLLVSGTSEAPGPLYLDAAGNVTERETSVADGWAVFVNLDQGVHEVFMSHPRLTCTPDPNASWPGKHVGAAAVAAWRDAELYATYPGYPNAISHTNAFGCR